MIDWHFSRKPLAEAYLAQFATGITSALTLFAPRRYGKTEFLLGDLLPLAEAAGYRVVYASMWANRADPLLALLVALDQALKPQNLRERVMSILNTPVKSVELEAEMTVLGKAKAGLAFGEEQTIGSTALLKIPALLDALTKKARNKQVLLLLDEVQYLAKPQYEDMVAALRTALDVRKTKVKVVYTGSSRVRLQRMFDVIKAPLFRSSQTTDFPELDKKFVDFMLRKVKQATGRVLAPDSAWKGFEEVSKSPGLFRDAIEAVILGGHADIVASCKATAQKAAAGAGYEETWLSFKDIDRAVLRRAISAQALYNEDACVTIAAEIGVTKLTPQQIQASVKRLEEAQVLLSKARGRYEIEDPGFEDWINNQ